MTDRELMQQALDVLMDAQLHNYALKHKETDDLIAALRERLSNPTREQLYNDIEAAVPGVSLKAYEALRVLNLALGESPATLTPKQRHAWEQARKALLSLGGCA